MRNQVFIFGDAVTMLISENKLGRPYRVIFDRIELSAVEMADLWTVQPTPTGKMYARGYFSGSQGTVPLHQYIMDRHDIERDGFVVDHKNGDSLDCRGENLRVTTQSVNCINRKSTPAASGVRGATAFQGRWHTGAHYCGKNIYLGRFADIRDSAHAVWLHLLEIDPISATSYLRSLPVYDEARFAALIADSRAPRREAI